MPLFDSLRSRPRAESQHGRSERAKSHSVPPRLQGYNSDMAVSRSSFSLHRWWHSRQRQVDGDSRSQDRSYDEASDRATSTSEPNGDSTIVVSSALDDKYSPAPSVPQDDAAVLGSHHIPHNPAIVISSDDAQDDQVDHDLIEASHKISNQNSSSSAENALDVIDDKILSVQDQISLLQAPATSVEDTIEATGAVKAIRDNVESFMETVPVLMDALDEVQKLHPFIGVALLPFKAVYTLEMKRRSNDTKITALYAEMKDMMEILIQLKRVKDEDEVGPGDITIKARMQKTVQQAANDIKECANACDAYSKEKLVVKVLKGPVWERTLASYAAVFVTRRSDFGSALAIHTGLAVDKANEKLDGLQSATRLMNEKMNYMLMFFRASIPADQRDITTLIQQKGGSSVVMSDDAALLELSGYEMRHSSSKATSASDTHEIGRSLADTENSDVEDLRLILREDPSITIRNNLRTFERKFEMQQRQIVEQLSQVVHHEGDRIIEFVASGPHDKVIDPYLHIIWKNMKWGWSVEVKRFIHALCDFYRERFEEKKSGIVSSETAIPHDSDEWAMEWIQDAEYQQPIIEAFDDDASGFLTISEANKFTTSRPLKWSLLHWIAYWAVGWQITATTYRDKIDDLIAKMFSLKHVVHPANRNTMDKYLDRIWSSISMLTQGFRGYTAPESLRAHFESFVLDEETRIRQNLESIRYNIDGMDTLTLVIGPGRVEKCLFPLIYLLLKRHYEILRLCRENIIAKDELSQAAATMRRVFRAVDDRYERLKVFLNQQKLDADEQFKIYASELYDFWHDTDAFWRRHRRNKYTQHTYNDELEEQNVDPASILNFPLQTERKFSCGAYDPEDIESEEDKRADFPLKAILGRWCGPLIRDNLHRVQPILTLWFHVSATDNSKFEASSHFIKGVPIDVSGQCETTTDGKTCYRFTMSCGRYGVRDLCGYLDEQMQTLEGKWDDRVRESGTFVFKRLAPEIMCFRPSPASLEGHKARALWEYATSAILYEVRRRLFSWSFFKYRRDIRRSYIELSIRYLHFGRPLDKEEKAERFRCMRNLTPADALFFKTVIDYRLSIICVHSGIWCDCCGGIIGGPRTICLDCNVKTLDLCDNPRCLAATIDRAERSELRSPHLPSHSVFKTRYMINDREMRRTLHDAREALKKAKAMFKEEPRSNSNASDSESDQHSNEVRRVPSCVQCREPVSRPCWYCAICKDDVFICEACDNKEHTESIINIQSASGHRSTHGLVKCQPDVNGKQKHKSRNMIARRRKRRDTSNTRRSPGPSESHRSSPVHTSSELPHTPVIRERLLVPFRNVMSGLQSIEDNSHDLSHTIYHAIDHFCLRMATVDAFPALELQYQFAHASWKAALNDINCESYELRDDVRSIITNSRSNYNEAVIDIVRAQIAVEYGFKSDDSEIDNVRRYKTLMDNFAFLYKQVDPVAGTRSGYAGHRLISELLYRVFFDKSKGGLAVKYSHEFNPIPLPTLAFLFTTMEHCLEEWSSGKLVACHFCEVGTSSSVSNSERFRNHLNNLEKWESLAPKVVLNIRKKWYERACKRGGVSLGISTSFSDEALQQAKTELEGRTGETDSELE